MSLRFIALTSVALAVALSFRGQPASANDDPWGGFPGERYPGTGYEAGYADPWPGPDDRYRDRTAMPGRSTPQFEEPSRNYGGWSPPPGSRGTGLGHYRDEESFAWGQSGPRDQGSSGSYPGSGGAGGSSSGYPWQAPDDQGYAFRPRGLPDGLEPGPGMMWPLPGATFADPPPDAYPGYRFRGDPPAHLGQWQSAPYETGYRFRPLTDQEQGRWGQDAGGSRGEWGGAARLSDPVLQPDAAYGFQPNPWRVP